MWIAVLFVAYSCAYIFRLTFVIDGVRYFTLADDQMISMRYAENLANGHGLVWNAGGPRVEGYTNFAWVLYMALFHAIHVPRPIISLCIQASGAACLLANLVFVRKIADYLSGRSDVVAMFALSLSAFYVPLDNWAFQGTEVSVLTLMVTAGAWLGLRVLDGRSPYLLYLLLATTTLVRPDMVVFGAAVLCGLAFAHRDHARQHLLIGGGILVASVATETAFRWWYFGDVLPNTYYLKMTGFPLLQRTTRGLLMACLLAAQLLPLIAIIGKSWRTIVNVRGAKVIALAFAAQVVYSIFVGGDSWEFWGGSNRFISIAMPLLFVFAALAAVNTSRNATIRAEFIALTIGFVILVNFLALASLRPFQRLTLIDRPLENQSDESNVRAAIELRQHTAPDALVAVTWAGAIPYFSQRPAIDLLGKMDVRIAREPMHRWPNSSNWTTFYPGHLKWDYQYSIRELKPDVIEAPLWRLSYELDAPEKYLAPEYEVRQFGADRNWYVRREAANVVR